MGIQDRQYYRDEEESRGGFQAGNSTMITKIVAVTVAIYILDMFIGGRDHWLMRDMASGPQDLMRPLYWWRYLTSGFAHDPSGYQHILYNMLSLWFLGRSVEAVYGSKEILRFYLIAIVLGSVTQAVRQYAMVPEAEWARCLGASGACGGRCDALCLQLPEADFAVVHGDSGSSMVGRCVADWDESARGNWSRSRLAGKPR